MSVVLSCLWVELLRAAVVCACVSFIIEILLQFHSRSTRWFLDRYEQVVKIEFPQMHACIFYYMIVWILCCCTAWTKIVRRGLVPPWLCDSVGKYVNEFLNLFGEGLNSFSYCDVLNSAIEYTCVSVRCPCLSNRVLNRKCICCPYLNLINKIIRNVLWTKTVHCL